MLTYFNNTPTLFSLSSSSSFLFVSWIMLSNIVTVNVRTTMLYSLIGAC